MTVTRLDIERGELEKEVTRLQGEVERLREGIAVYNEYIQLLTDELNEVVTLAAVHGWKSTRYEKGKELREKIEALSILEGLEEQK